MLIGTEAVLHRASDADVVAFLDLDAELLAPRYRPAEQAMALLARAARLVGPRSGGGRLLVQTFLPRHEVLQAVLHADPSRVSKVELAPARAAGSAAVRRAGRGDGCRRRRVRRGDRARGLVRPATSMLLRAPTWDALGAAIAATPRPKGSRLRIEVDPPR